MVSMLVVFCDNCFMEGRRNEGKTSTLGVDGRWRSIHLCDECAEAFGAKDFTSVVDFYREHGETPQDVTPISPEDFPCLWCDRPPFNLAPSLMAHLKAAHRLTPADNPWGHVCPLCGESHDSLPNHVGRKHAMHISQAMLKAENQGDPYRAVFAVRKRLNT